MKSVLSNNAVMSEIWNGDCLKLLPNLPSACADFILTDPPYITRYRSCDGRIVPNDNHDAWLKPAFAEMYRVLKPDSFAVSFYGWPKADRFLTAFRAAGFRVVGHFVFPKRYTSTTRLVRYQHEAAYLLAKGNPKPQAIIGDVAFLQELTISGADKQPPIDDMKATVCTCLHHLLPALHSNYAELIRRIDLEGEAPKRVAEELKVSQNNLTVRLHRARQALRASLELYCGVCSTHGCLNCTCG